MNAEEIELTTIPAIQQGNRQVVRFSAESIRDQTPVVLTWTDLNVTGKNSRTVLRGSGQINGGLWAIMGPSGSGKSTLLNTLACRLDPRFKISGDIRLNGKLYTATELKRMAGYVMQDDLLNAYFTVEETLTYTAHLRLPGMSDQEKKERIRFVIDEMSLSHCKDVIIGDTLRKGISGGERKRVCIAQELLLQPGLLFLDEPTSGLDSATALDLIQKLHTLSHTLCTVVCSIHQPQSKIFNLFDSLILLKRGQIIFFGSTRRALAAFSQAGFPVPALTNPADHMIDILSATPIQEGFMETDDLIKKFDSSSRVIDPELGVDIPLLLREGQVPWIDQFKILCKRNFHEQSRKRNIIAISLFQTIVVAVLIGTVFFRIGTGQASTRVRQPVLFFCCINQGMFGSLAVLNSFPSERALSLRERAAGTYNISAYFLAKTFVDAVVQLITPVLFSLTVYFLTGFQNDVNKFFIFTAFMMLTNLCATSVALMVSALCRTTDFSVAVLPMALEVSRLFGGFFLSPALLPPYFAWLDALSFYKYAYVGISQNELNGLVLSCQPTESNCIRDGQYTIDLLGLDYISIGGCAGVLIAYMVFTRFVAFFGVKYLKN